MKKLIILLFLVLGSSAAIAQQAIRKELYRSGNLSLNSYHFMETDEYLFILRSSFETEIDQTPYDGRFDTRAEIFRGDTEEAKHFFGQLADLMVNNPRDKNVAVRIGPLIIQRGKSLTGFYNQFVLSEGRIMGLSDKHTRKINDAFLQYCASQGI